jgi:Uma2 family endonuclease
MSVVEAQPVVSPPRMRDDVPLTEFINGEIVEMPPMSFHSGKIASRLAWKLGPFADANGLGTAVIETLFHIPTAEDPGRNRRPDLAFVSYNRWPKDRPESVRENAWDVIPDLAIEVVSPSDKAIELLEKVGEFLEAGVRQVWVVYPRGVIYVHDSVESVRSIGPAGVLDGGDILPGFRLPLAELFVYPTIEEREPGDE